MPKSFVVINMPYQLKVETKDSKGVRYNQGGMLILAKIQPKTAGHQGVAGKVEDHKDGTYTITFTPQGTGPHQFNKPSGLAIKEDVLFVADCNNHRIQVLSVSGEFLHMFGKLGSGQGEFRSPSAVTG